MKILITVDNGRMFHLDTGARRLTSMDRLGKPFATISLQQDPRVVPGYPLIFACVDGTKTTDGNIVQLIYSQ